MSILDCCKNTPEGLRKPNESIDSLYFHRDGSQAWSKVAAVVGIIFAASLAIYITLNLASNPNYSLIEDATTLSQKHFVYSCLVLGPFFAAISLYLHGRYKYYGYQIDQYNFHQMKLEEKVTS